MNMREESRKEVEKDRRTILRKEKKRERVVEVRKTAGEEKVLREVMMKIGLKRIDMQERIMVEILLDSGVTGLVMSLEFAKK